MPLTGHQRSRRSASAPITATEGRAVGAYERSLELLPKKKGLRRGGASQSPQGGALIKGPRAIAIVRNFLAVWCRRHHKVFCVKSDFDIAKNRKNETGSPDTISVIAGSKSVLSGRRGGRLPYLVLSNNRAVSSK